MSAQPLGAFWAMRSRREQVLLGLLAALLLASALWFGLWQPLARAQLNAADRLATATADRAAIAAMAPRIEAAGARAQQGGGQTVLSQVEAAAAAAGLALTSVEPAGPGRVSARVAAARAPVLLQMLGALEADGLQLVALSASRNEDATVTASFTFAGAGQ